MITKDTDHSPSLSFRRHGAGDLVWVRSGVLPADVVLLRGECIADEAMLTGEAVPVRKSPYSPHSGGPPYNPEEDKACTLYGGTSIAQVLPLRVCGATSAPPPFRPTWRLSGVKVTDTSPCHVSQF
jgi:hypothetical protein